ncbi:MAG TPA: septum formation initiator family protein [Candidatus Acidoferrales bacterium]|nr:septum formation initiator family protein [Candidatus Acidoferrales bacterium]
MSRRARKRESPWRLRLRRAGVYAGGALVVLVLMHTLFGPYGYLSMRRSEREIEQLRQEIDRLDRENVQLSGEIRALQTDPAAIEKAAREDMGLARPGEIIFRLPDDPAPPAGMPAPASAPAQNPPRQ